MPDDGFTIRDAEDDEPPSRDGKAAKRRREDATTLAGAAFWCAPDGKPHASIDHPRGHLEHVRTDSTPFRNFLQARTYALQGGGLSGQVQQRLVHLANALAAVGGDVRRPWRRVALGEDGAIYLDLGGGDPAGERRAVRIAVDGWRVVPAAEVPVIFLRDPYALPLPVPEVDAASAADLLAFVNADDGDDLALLWAWIMCALRPFAEGGAHPILLLHGEQGSGKSGATRVLQAIIDPSALTGRSPPRRDDERDVYVSLANRLLFVQDNLSSISDFMADCYSRIATGGGFSTRALNTDSDEVVFTAVRPILMNGIPSTLLGRPDLADRAISIELRPLAQRREEAEMAADFARMRPGLLGLLCDGLSSALRNLPTTRIPDPPRMIDACTWAEAAAQGLGIEPGRIAAAWRANRGAADRAALEVDDVAQAVVALLQEETERSGAREWKGSPADLYRRLAELVPERVARGPLWPKNAAGLGTKLRRIAPGLRAVHRIEAAHGKGGADGARWWSVRRV